MTSSNGPMVTAGGQTAGTGGLGDDILCIGDLVCFYCPEVYGFIYSKQSSAIHNTLAVSRDPDQRYPNLPDPHVATFKVCTANRYKFDKQFRKLQKKCMASPDDVMLKAKLHEAEQSSLAEQGGNLAEQKRLQGKPVTYGATIQLKHTFSNGYIHVNTSKTSKTSSSDMMVELLPYSVKNAHFKIMPRYKVKSEGDVVRYDDQIVLESIKSAGQYLKISSLGLKHPMSPQEGQLEVNLSVRQSGLKIYRFSKRENWHHKTIVGGSTIRLFHKELEAYLVAEGLFEWHDLQTAHLRIREVDPANPKTMSYSTSAITYWQLELQEGPLVGEPIRWESQVRLRNLVTRKYVSVESNGTFNLTKDGKDPRTVWRITPVIRDEVYVMTDSYARFEHVVSGMWLHALPTNFVKKRRPVTAKSSKRNAMSDLQWDKSQNKMIGLNPVMQYDDAFTIQQVTPDLLEVFRFAAGCVPMLQTFVSQKQEGVLLTEDSCNRICSLLDNLKQFMFENGAAQKYRQKLLRNLMIVELLIAGLQLDLSNAPDHAFLTKVFIRSYDVLFTYLLGDSRKNELYMANHVEFFLTQIGFQGEVGIWATAMVTELIRDNRQIVDRMGQRHIDSFIHLLFKNQNYRYLDLLNVLCVCDGVSIPDNQNYICQKWLEETFESSQTCCFLTETGGRLSRRKGTKYDKSMTYVSTNNGETWKSLIAMIQEGDTEKIMFLTHQLDLFEKLTSGRNQYCNTIITTTLDYLTWEEAFMCMSDERLPSDLRAKYCSLVIVLFVDFGENYSVLDRITLTFDYSEIGNPNKKLKGRIGNMLAGQDDDTDSLFHRPSSAATFDSIDSNKSPEESFRENVTRIQTWIANFLGSSQSMVASEIGYNQMIKQVLRMVWYLVAFGYYSDSQGKLQKLVQALITIMDGMNDTPYPVTHMNRLQSAERTKMLKKFKENERFRQSEQNNPIAEAKLQAMEILDLVLNIRFNYRISSFIHVFKQMHASMKGLRGGGHENLIPLLNTSFDIQDDPSTASKAKAVLAKLVAESALLKDGGLYLKEILLDLSRYDYDKMITMSMHLLTRYFSAHEILFERAIHAQVVINDSSVKLFREVSEKLPVLRRLTSSKLSDEQIQVILPIMDYFRQMCVIDEESGEPHRMNQNILYNQDVIGDIFDILNQKVEAAFVLENEGLKLVRENAFLLLKAMAHEHPVIQCRLYDRMFELLNVMGADRQLAMVLTEIFTHNKNNCLKCPKDFIKRVMKVLSVRKEPEFLVLLQAIVKVEEINLPVKGNQNSVMKFFMEHREEIAPMLTAVESGDNPETFEKLNRMIKDSSNEDTGYLVNLVDLFATCAEGENRFIESICQTVFTVDELLELLVDRDITHSIKKAMLRFFLWVYINTGGGGDIDVDFASDLRVWAFLKLAKDELEEMTSSLYTDRNAGHYIKRLPGLAKNARDPHWSVHYYFEAVLPFFEIFFKDFFDKDKVTAQQTSFVTQLANALFDFTKCVMPDVNSATRAKLLIKCTSVVMGRSNASQKTVLAFKSQFGNHRFTEEFVSEARKKYNREFSGEEEINDQLNEFSRNMKKCYGGVNTVQTQIGFPSQREYSEIQEEGGDEELPLGEEFQTLLACFDGDRPKKLINTLWIQDHNAYSNEKSRVQAIRLDIKCLKLLRALIHNEERKLPENWESIAKVHEKQLEELATVQNKLNTMGAVNKTIGLLAKPNEDVVRETLAFLVAMLFNGNETTQDQFLDFFLGTREETFFFNVKSRMNISSIATKEKKSLLSQYEAKIKEALKMMRNLQANERDIGKSKSTFGSRFKLSSSRLQMMPNKSMKSLRKSSINMKGLNSSIIQEADGKQENGGYLSLPIKTGGQPIETEEHDGDTFSASMLPLPGTTATAKVHPETFSNNRPITSQTVNAEDPLPDLETGDNDFDSSIFDVIAATGDDGYIELILKMLALMCDGQHQGVQNYLREQPDNIKSFNLVAETCIFLQILYSNINGVNITLVTGIFSTLLEMASGNFHNQVVCFDHKVIECINHILRVVKFEGCLLEEIFEMKMKIAELLTAVIEENNDENCNNIREIKESLDHYALLETIVTCYRLVNLQDADVFVEMGLDESFKEEMEQNEEVVTDVGFKYFYILVRLQDIHGNILPAREVGTKMMGEVSENSWQYFENNCMSVEILKNGFIQKLTFRVKNKDVLRQEVKEMMKWEVDRSSPSNKIRDFVAWSQDIINDIKYQTRVMSNPIARFVIRHGNAWHNLLLLVTLILNALILFSWKANTDDLFTWKPVKPLWYPYLLYSFGGLHVLLALMIVLEYFISNRPQLPSLKETFNSVSEFIGFPTSSSEEDEASAENHLQVDFLSLKTFYYIIFLAASVLALLFEGYLFCFHMLHVVPRSQMLMRVLKSVTQNGTSLLLVAFLGVIIIWIYAVAGFAFVRYAFTGSDGLYCETMLQCFVTSLRFGVIDGLQNYVTVPEKYASFDHYALRMMYDVSFFIIFVTILMNIIFGIIVDTFSELRDLKWQTEEDMTSKCFICSRGSYDFEHHGKGFDHHVKKEHNMWAYLFYFIHLDETRINDYTANDLYVYRLLQRDNYDFFPLNRALVLDDEGDEVESKLDSLQQSIGKILQRQEELELMEIKRSQSEKIKEFKESYRSKATPRQKVTAQATGDQGSSTSDSTSGGNQQASPVKIRPLSAKRN